MVITKDEGDNDKRKYPGSARGSRKKIKRDPSKKEHNEQFNYVLGPYDMHRDNATYIQGYTGHWKDPVYIKLMHGRLNNKLNFFVNNMNRIMVKMSEAYGDNQEAAFIQQLKTMVINPLRVVTSTIDLFGNALLHVLSRESIAKALHIHDNEDTVNIIYKMCITQNFDGSLTYNNETNHVRFLLNFDNQEYTFQYMTVNPSRS